jgi:hypothetical protein
MNLSNNIKEIFKPIRYTKIKNVTILESMSGNVVIKKKNNNIKSIYDYLSTRDFNNYPRLLNYSNLEDNIYEYIEDLNKLYPQKDEDFIKLVGLLHSKTSYIKEVSKDIYQELYENILNNIEYYLEYYNKYYNLYLKSRYMSPSNYLFTRNYSKIRSSLLFSKDKLEYWYSNIENKTTERLCLIHNNLERDHYLKGSDKDYLISFDKAKFDSPVIDLVKLYKTEFFNMEFNSLFNDYLKINPLNEDEIDLFFILISIPLELNIEDNELLYVKNIRYFLDYIYKTESILESYYSSKEENK